MFSSTIILKENIEQYTTIFVNVNNYFVICFITCQIVKELDCQIFIINVGGKEKRSETLFWITSRFEEVPTEN